VLSLDLATVVGWCYGHLQSRSPAFGTWRLPHVGGEGAKYAAFENELVAAMDRWKPSKLLVEATLPLMALAHGSTHRVAAQQFTLRGFVYTEGYRASIPVFEKDARSVRQDILGQGQFPKDQVKREVFKWCRNHGWRVPDHNAADAALLWEWHRRQMIHAAGPLWSAA
jgi:Holliday junction resolvasome RuvABC endonuclease subunit